MSLAATASRSYPIPAWLKLVAAPALGALAALGVAPIYWPAATVLGLSLITLLLNDDTQHRRAAVLLWLFGVGYFGVALRWITEPFQVEAEVYGWMAPFALGLMAAGLALFWGAAGWLACRWSRPGPVRALALVLALSVAELARAYVFTGFPWAALAQIWVESQAAGLLAWIGPHGLAFLTLGFASLPGLLRRVALPASLVPALIVLAFGAIDRPAIAPDVASDRPLVRIVQPNAPQDEKWHPEKWQTFFWRQVEATRAPGPRPDLVVWPEASIPYLLENADSVLPIMAEAAGDTTLAFGVQRGWPNVYNTLAVMDGGEITQTYDKHHLVPFGEYMPFPALFRRLGIRGLAERADGGYARGPGPELLDFGALGQGLPLICYEAVFPQHATRRGARPNFLLQVTNDAWFGVASGPQQHLAQAQMRAIEQGLPLIRSANTGISALIAPNGAIQGALALGTDGFLDLRLPPAAPPTLYARAGDLPFTALLALACIGLGLFQWRRNSD